MVTSKHISDFLDAINGSQKALIVGHQFPDLDAVGSCLALEEYLNSQSIETVVWFAQNIKKGFSILENVKSVQSNFPVDFDYDTIFVCDSSNFERVKDSHLMTKKKKRVVNLDHHADNIFFGDINIVDIDISSVGELFFYLFEGCDWPLTPSVATNLYTAISFDTGRFAFSNVSHRTLHAAAVCVQQGADPYSIYQFMEESKTLEDFSLIKLAMDRLSTDASSKIAFTTIPHDAPKGYIKIIDVIRQLGGSEVVLVFQELQSQLIKINLRSKYDFDVSTFAQQYGGGGHKKAAGILYKGSLKKAVSTFIPALTDSLKNG